MGSILLLETNGHWDLAAEALQPWSGNFRHWRFETIALVFADINRIWGIAQRFLFASTFGSIEDKTLLGEVVDALTNDEFSNKMRVMNRFVQRMEQARIWGNWCPCCPNVKPIRPCPRNARSRRLHQARQYIRYFLAEWKTMRGCPSELEVDNGLTPMVTHCCDVAANAVAVQFHWLSTAPFLYSEADTASAATAICNEMQAALRDPLQRGRLDRVSLELLALARGRFA